MKKHGKIILIVIAAGLVSLSFHPLRLHFLAWIGLVPLLFAVDNLNPGQSFRYGLVFGFLFALFSLFWIVFLQIDMNTKLLIIFGLIVLFMYLGLYYGVALLIAKKIGLWYLPIVVAGLEFLRGIGELRFPWLSLGYTQARYPLFIQQAAIYGVYGISLWLVLLNVSIYYTLKRKKLGNLFLAIIIFVLPVLYGITRSTDTGERMVTVGIVQPNIDPNMKFSRELRYKTFERLMQLSIRCASTALHEYDDTIDIIVWPETATPVFLKSPGSYRDLVTHLANKLDVPIFTGTAIYDPKTHEIFNGAVLVEPASGIAQEYRKIYLVPFGEHIPFDNHIALLRNVDFGEGDYTPGTDYTVFKTAEFNFACLICFESIFPDMSRRFVNEGADVLINITNDGWFGKISGAQQHNDMAILRSVENGTVLFRCANTGISMIVDQFGRVTVEKPLFVEEVIVSSLSIAQVDTIFQRFGHLLPLVCVILTTIVLTANISRAYYR